jgi:hypothetical protein
MRTKLLTGAAVVVALGMIAVPVASAHHGSRISYDMNRMVTVEGVVTEFDWMNPHVYFLFDVTDDKGAVTHWAAETDPPSTMTRYGWSKSYLKPGDKVTVTVWPSKVGSPRGFLAKLVKADGTVTDHTGQLPPE